MQDTFRQILLDYGLYIIWGLGILEIIFTAILLRDFKQKRDPLIICMALVGVGLCYDALIIGIGGMILIPLLQVLSRARFILHGLLVPLNVALCGYAVPFYRKMMNVTWAVTILLMIAGGASGFFREIDMTTLGTVTRYVSVSPDNSWMEIVDKLLSFGGVIPVILTGIWLLIKQKSPSILLAGALMFAFSALGPATGNADLIFIISMFGELFLLLFYMIYEKRHIN